MSWLPDGPRDVAPGRGAHGIRRALAGLALGGALLSAACGSGRVEQAQVESSAGGQPTTAPAPAGPTREETVERANEACAQAAREIDELVDESDRDDPAGEGRFGERRLTLQRDLADTLAALVPPAEREPSFDRFVEAVDLSADLREEILEKAAAGDRQAAEQAAMELADAVEDARRAASDYGLVECEGIGPD
ncbi:MAG TPA: hypothetical protein VGV36_08195 [Solirubrobacteraceae bacterium]|nr:hypothetical protein [Solirubrobacteraceae bacterium]